MGHHVLVEAQLAARAQHAAQLAQRGLDRAGIWPLVGGGCHLGRDTLGAVAAAGFAVERVRRLRFPPGALGLPHVLGIARRP